ncbi:hypothetical protein [Paenibacillus contaminans]|uniref:Uncharacterized protein n=1 Tax=Paenibacillus contaminans TaxID=450362 RepID=A0A329MI38_9BACL|nr:hypothetical protein [Paenibacillus contaminans]RAV19474.1 hypothetical protein DQG23_21015 [Paenibacillus contaminans]
MSNYGEELAYWYLRLNGFFTINNFVLHHNREGRTSDADILAVRFPYVYEEVGGRDEDWDNQLVGRFNKDKIVGLICEVKTGLDFDETKLFKEVNLSKALGRFGFTERLDRQADELSIKPSLTIDNYEIYKVLISTDPQSPRTDCLHIKLVDVQRFIKERMKKYVYRKLSDRMFFQSELLQYMIWEESMK